MGVLSYYCTSADSFPSQDMRTEGFVGVGLLDFRLQRVASDGIALGEGQSAGSSLAEGKSAGNRLAEGCLTLCKRNLSRATLCKRNPGRATLWKPLFVRSHPPEARSE